MTFPLNKKLEKQIKLKKFPLVIVNGIVNSIAGLITSITSIIGSILIVKFLNPDDYGELSYYLWIAGFLSMIISLNLPFTITKITSELRGAGEVEEVNLLTIKTSKFLLLFSLFVSVILLIFGLTTATDDIYKYLIIATILIPTIFSSLERSFLWGNQKYKFIAISNIVSSLLSLILIIIGYYYSFDLHWFIFANLSPSIFQLIMLSIYIGLPNLHHFKFLLTKIKLKKSTKKLFIDFAIPAAIYMLVEIVVTQRSEVFFIKRYREIAEVGYYSLAFTIYSLFLGIGLTLIHGFYPAISTDIGSNAWEKVQNKVNKGVLVSVIYAIPIIFGCIIIIDLIIRFLYGEKMIVTVPIIQVLILGLFPGMIVGISGLLLSAIGGIWDRVFAGIFSVIVNIILSILLIPNNGVLGAAISNVISQLVNASLLYLIIKNKYKINYPWKQILIIALAGVIFTGAFPYILMILLPSTIGSIISIVLAIIAYYASLKILKIWNYLSEQ